jgi:hypothetical protein
MKPIEVTIVPSHETVYPGTVVHLTTIFEKEDDKNALYNYKWTITDPVGNDVTSTLKLGPTISDTEITGKASLTVPMTYNTIGPRRVRVKVSIEDLNSPIKRIAL